MFIFMVDMTREAQKCETVNSATYLSMRAPTLRNYLGWSWYANVP